MSIIYELFDPLNNVVFYVGQTVNVPQRYFDGHLRLLYKEKTKLKGYWIKHLLDQGVYPQIKTIDYIERPSQVDEAEGYWIVYRLAEGCPLVNKSFYMCGQWGLNSAKAKLIANKNLIEYAENNYSFTLRNYALKWRDKL